MTSHDVLADPRPSPLLRTGLWTVQIVLAVTFVGGGLWKLTTPIDQLAESFPWAGEVSVALVRGTSLLDVLGGLGIVLPSVTRVRPRLTVLAALGCAALQIGAAVFHLGRGEASDMPLNVALVALALFVAWGRNGPAPIAAR